MEKHTHKLQTDLTLDLKTRLKTLSRQINGVLQMLDQGRDPEQISVYP